MAGPFVIRLADGGAWPCNEGDSVLVAMQRANAHGIFFGCRGGGCGACRVRVSEGRYSQGKISRSHVSESEQAEGYSLACRLYPQSDMVISPQPKR